MCRCALSFPYALLYDFSEGHDRTEITLPGHQVDLITAVAGASKGPVILVVMTGGPVDISAAKVRSSLIWLSVSQWTMGISLCMMTWNTCLVHHLLQLLMLCSLWAESVSSVP